MKNNKWTHESLQKEALKYKSRGDFCKKSSSAYVTARKRGVLNEVCSHMTPIGKKWDLVSLQKEALKYKSRGDFQKGSPSAYQILYSRDVLNEACSHMVNMYKKWDLESLKLEALKYSTKIEFKKKSTAYFVATKMGIIDQICSHMKVLWIKKWNPEIIKKEALKYTSPGDFQMGSPKAYDAAIKRNILKEVCSHMKMGKTTSCSEFYIMELIKKHYPKTLKLRDRKVKIPNKPHIQGLEIDIYVPELRKGIEFDGFFHHSYEGLKRGRPNWTDEDIRNYHEIKDSWFASKGIQILHIKEEDWIKDRDGCVKKCLGFLSK